MPLTRRVRNESFLAVMSPRGVASLRPKYDAARLDIPRVHTPFLFLLIIGRRDIKRADLAMSRESRACLIRLKHRSQVLTSLLARPSDKKSDATSLPAFSRWGQGHVFFSSKPTRWNRTLLPFTGLCSLSPDFIVTSLFKGSVLTLADPSSDFWVAFRVAANPDSPRSVSLSLSDRSPNFDAEPVDYSAPWILTQFMIIYRNERRCCMVCRLLVVANFTALWTSVALSSEIQETFRISQFHNSKTATEHSACVTRRHYFNARILPGLIPWS